MNDNKMVRFFYEYGIRDTIESIRQSYEECGAPYGPSAVWADVVKW